MRFILFLVLMNYFLRAVLDVQNTANIRIYALTLTIYELTLGIYAIIIWLLMILPSLLVRLIYRDRLNQAMSILLAAVGIFAASVFLTYMGESIKGSLVSALCVACAYKLAHSYFGLRSLGLPFALGTISRKVKLQAEAPPQPEPSPSSESTHDSAPVQPPATSPNQAASPEPVITAASPASTAGARMCTLGVYMAATLILAVILFIVYVQKDYYGGGYTVAAIMAAVIILSGYWLSPRLSGIISKSLSSYRADHPINAIAYFIIWLAGFCAWTLIALLPLLIAPPRHTRWRMLTSSNMPTFLGCICMLGILLLVQFGISMLRKRSATAQANHQ